MLCVFRTGRFTVRREHNSKLIVTVPSGVQPSGNTDGKKYFEDIVLLISIVPLKSDQMKMKHFVNL